jgi:DNA replication protein DnaC
VGVREAPTVDWDGKDRPRLISGLRKAGVDERYLHVEWGKVQTAHLAMVRKYADTLPTRVDRGEGILLWGDRGSGKSSIAALVMQEAVKADITCRWWNVTDLQTLFASRTFEKQDNLQRAQRVPLLVLDDYAVAAINAEQAALMDAIIEGRYRRRVSTVVTTNVDPRRLDADDRYARSIDRMKQTMVPVEIGGKSRRSAHKIGWDE